MPSPSNMLADRLLGRLPNPSETAHYREELFQKLKAEQKRLQFQRVATFAFWVFCAVSATVWLWFTAAAVHLPRGPIGAGILLICGAVEVIKHAVNASRFEILREVKQLQIQVFDLEQKLESRTAAQI